MSIPETCVSPTAAFAYIAGRLNGYSTEADVVEFPSLAAEAVAECVAIAKHFLAKEGSYRMAPHEHSGYEIGSGGAI